MGHARHVGGTPYVHGRHLINHGNSNTKLSTRPIFKCGHFWLFEILMRRSKNSKETVNALLGKKFSPAAPKPAAQLARRRAPAKEKPFKRGGREKKGHFFEVGGPKMA